jgi:hypothetical protein
MKTRWIVSALVVSCGLSGVCHAQYQTERGAAIGGIGGALAGAAIGKNNGDTGACALLGGAVWLVTGAVVGNSMEQKQRVQAYEQQRAYQLSRAVSTTDVITMARNGLSDEVIVNHIRENGVQRRLEVSDVIMLHKNGVSEATIAAMQNAPVGTPVYVAPPAPRYVAPAPVIVQEYHYVRPPYWGPHYYGHYHHHHHGHHYRHGHGHGHGHGGVHWGVTFGN